jgi:hypothetical protein
MKWLEKSPAHFKAWKEGRLGESTPAMEGIAIHSAVLEPDKFRDTYFESVLVLSLSKGWHILMHVIWSKNLSVSKLLPGMIKILALNVNIVQTYMRERGVLSDLKFRRVCAACFRGANAEEYHNHRIVPRTREKDARPLLAERLPGDMVAEVPSSKLLKNGVLAVWIYPIMIPHRQAGL